MELHNRLAAWKICPHIDYTVNLEVLCILSWSSSSWKITADTHEQSTCNQFEVSKLLDDFERQGSEICCSSLLIRCWSFVGLQWSHHAYAIGQEQIWVSYAILIGSSGKNSIECSPSTAWRAWASSTLLSKSTMTTDGPHPASRTHNIAS